MIRQGSSGGELFLLDRGIAKLEHITRSGRGVVLGWRFSGQFVGEIAALLNGANPYSASAITEVYAYPVNAGRLLDVAQRDRSAAGLLLTSLTWDCRLLLDTIFALKAHTPERRYTRLLSQLAALSGRRTKPRRSFRLQVPVSEKEIAALISVSPEHLSRLKKKMEAGRQLQKRGNFLIVRTGQRNSN